MRSKAKTGERGAKPLFTRLTPEARRNLDEAAQEFNMSVADVVNELLGDIGAVQRVLMGDPSLRDIGRTIEVAAKIESAVRAPRNRPIGRFVKAAKRHARIRTAKGVRT